MEDYYREINAAARDGRVADVSATAMAGCQTCALDIGMTRLFEQRGLRADAAPYEITEVTPGERTGILIAVRYRATTRSVQLLDLAGRPTATEPGVPTRAATARLTLSRAGWRIETITYAAEPS